MSSICRVLGGSLFIVAVLRGGGGIGSCAVASVLLLLLLPLAPLKTVAARARGPVVVVESGRVACP